MDEKYQVMPDLLDAEYKELKASIAESGVMVPIELDEDGNVLDGHHRLRACAELGITDYPTVIRDGLSEQEKLLHAFTLNSARRQLTRDQKVKAATDLLKRDPSISDRKIAKAVGLTHPTVAKYRRQLEEKGQVVKFTTRTGEDGKTYSVADPDEELLKKDSFTCCICGTEHPAYYYRDLNGKVVNGWGWDPWPLPVEGDCCQRCNSKLEDARQMMGVAAWREHRLGSHWREKMDTYDEMLDDGWKYPRFRYTPSTDEDRKKALEFEAELERRVDEKVSQYFENMRTTAARIVDVAEKADTLEVWEAARSAIDEMQQDNESLMEAIDTRMQEL